MAQMLKNQNFLCDNVCVYVCDRINVCMCDEVGFI